MTSAPGGASGPGVPFGASRPGGPAGAPDPAAHYGAPAAAPMAPPWQGITPPRPPERRVARLRRHARVVIIPSLVLIAAAAVVGYSTRGLRESGPWALWSTLAICAAILFGIVPIVLWLRGRSTITTVRTISRRPLASMSRELLHHQVVEVIVRRNPWQAIFGSGTIRLISLTGERLDLIDVPNVKTVAQAVRELTGNVGR